MRSVVVAALAISFTSAFIAGCKHIDPPTPITQLTQEQTVGYMVFQTHCEICHYERLNQPKNGPSLEGIFKKPYLPSGAPANEERVTATILHGRGLMPAQNLDPGEIAAILAYLHTV